MYPPENIPEITEQVHRTEESVLDKIDWGAVNQPISEDVFNRLYDKVLNYLNTKNEIYV